MYVTVYQTWNSMLPVLVEPMRRRTMSNNVDVHPTTSVAHVNAVPMDITDQRKDLTLGLVYHVLIYLLTYSLFACLFSSYSNRGHRVVDLN